MDYLNDGAWFPGLDSISFQLGQGQYQWGQNITNRGGMIGTRQGFAQIAAITGDQQVPRGVCLFAPKQAGVNPYIVAAIGQSIYYLPYPYTGNFQELGGVSFPAVAGTFGREVQFEVCVQANKTDEDGNVIAIPPRFVLMMQDGVNRPGYWYFDRQTSHSGHVGPAGANAPTFNTPTGTHMKWAGDRLWVSAGNRLHAGDLLNPLQFEEEKVQSTGGFFFLPGTVTGMGVTHDYKSLLVYTHQTTSAFQVGILDRTLWEQTQDFQRVLFPSIGCASHRTIINMYGMTWWMSHDGVMALDSSLQAFQTSRMQVKDHNMSRSKEGLKWNQGGGCAGSYGNWLFFSVPSGSKYNAHTWVMDQAVQQDLNGIAPPAWCSNWTGIRPEQWVTGIVNGIQRCFCISSDLVPDGRQATIWEAFIGQRMDVPKNVVTGDRLPKDIACAFETRFMGLAPNQYARFRYAEIDLAEIIGNVRIKVFYCGRRTSYKKILDKKLTAQVSPASEEIFRPEDPVNVYVTQYRTVRTVTDSHDADDFDTGVQTQYIRSIDREFSLLITWTGQLSVTGIRMCLDAISDYQEGVAEEDELTSRRITAEGSGPEITGETPPPNTFTGALTSKFLAPFRPRWVEFPAYDSAVTNEVFFTARPEFSPPARGYPSTEYPKSVTITSETEGAKIMYTLDRTAPSKTHGTLYAGPVSVPINTYLRAIAFRDGLADSEIETGRYDKLSLSPPVILPAGGKYPAAQYPKTITISATSQPSLGGGSNYTRCFSNQANSAIIGIYHDNVSLITDQLQTMRDNGQNKISFVLWYAPLPAGINVQNHVVTSRGGVMPVQQQTNCQDIMALCNSLGFDEVHFRFSPQGRARPPEWTEFDGERFRENRDYILSVRNIVAAAAGGLPVVFDLSAELVNNQWHDKPWMRRYAIQLWSAYTAAHGPIDSCGMTCIHGQMDKMISAFKSADLPLPGCYAIDHYPDADNQLIHDFNTMKDNNEGHKGIYLQETFYNDAQTAREIIDAKEAGVILSGVFQWPVIRGHQHEQYFPDVYPKAYNHYLGL